VLHKRRIIPPPPPSLLLQLEWCKFGVRFLEGDRDVAKAAQYLERALAALKGAATANP
jgi:hypothetical protein